MTIVEGQIESLKKLKKELEQNRIYRFNSIGEINTFLNNYESEKSEIPNKIKYEVDLEIQKLESDLIKFQQDYEKFKNEITSKLKVKIDDLDARVRITKDKSDKNILYKIIIFPKLTKLRSSKSYLENNFEKIINKQTSNFERDVNNTKKKLNNYFENKNKIILERCSNKIDELCDIKKVVDGLYPLIAGTIGENLVVKELQKLPDEYILFNDFTLEFDPPIYNKSENDRIYSIQIDHLLVSNSGIFILETKNWSKKSIESLDLRSPVDQIKRTSYALFVMLNSDSGYNKIKLHSHHWGNKQIPIRNVIVMIHEKPKEKFKYVQVKLLNELVGYIKYFEPIFNEAEVKSITGYIKKLCH